MTTTKNIYAAAFAIAFEEWERRRRRDPAAFEMPVHAGDAGVAMARQFLAILEERAAGLPWELVGHVGERAVRTLAGLVPGGVVTFEGGPDEILALCLTYPGELSRADYLALEEAAPHVAKVFGIFRVRDTPASLAAEGRGRHRVTISATARELARPS